MKKRYFISILLFVLFLGVLLLVLTNKIEFFDTFVYEKIFSLRSDFFDSFFKILTFFGNTFTVIILLLLFLFLLSKKDKILLGSTVVLTVGINQLLKHLIERPRPDHLRLIEEKGYSFPSGHAMIAIALYGTLFYLVYQKVSNKYLKIGLMIFLIFLMIGIGCSRIYLGVHYPSDILGGYLLALVILILCIDQIGKTFKEEEK